MLEAVDVESTSVKNVGFAAKNQACSKNISALILMYGLTCASCVILPSKLKVGDPFCSETSLFSFVHSSLQREIFHQNEMVLFVNMELHKIHFFLVSQ